MADEKIPDELRHLASYLGQSDENKAMEVLCSGAFLLSGDERASFAERALGELSGKSAARVEAFLEHLEDDPDDDDGVFFDLACGYDDVHRALARDDSGNLVMEMLDRFTRFAMDEEQPSWSYLDYRGTRPRGWLLHCTSAGGDVSVDGFIRGVPDVTKLGLTTHLGDIEKDLPGYNFAYEADRFNRYAFDRNGVCRYGGDVLLFRAPYVETWHRTDEEPQAIFWGPSATDIILLTEVSRGYYMLELDPPADLDDDDYDYDDWVIEASSVDELIEKVEERMEHVPRLPNPFDPEPRSRIRRRVLR